MAAFAWLPVIVCAAGVNPYLLPDTFDNIVYLVGAESLLDHGSYRFGGYHVWAWPPGLSGLLALPMAFLGRNVWVAKLVVLGFVALGCVAAKRRLEQEQRPLPALTVAIWGLAPTAMLQGTRVLSDWPYAALSLVVLCLLPRLCDGLPARHSDAAPGSAVVRWLTAPPAVCVAAAAALAVAVLVRQIGVLLVAALAAQGALKLWRTRKLHAALPEAGVAVLGLLPFVAWKLWLSPHRADGTALVEYQADLSFLAHANVGESLGQLLDALTQARAVVERLGLGAPVTVPLGLALLALFVLGAWARVRRSGVVATDAYVVAVLALCFALEWKYPRYLLPIGPFLVSDVLAGVAVLAGRRGPRVALVAGAIWCFSMGALDVSLLMAGNGRSHGGLSPLLSRTAHEFYRGSWRDLSDACEVVRRDPSAGAVVVLGRTDLKYPAYLCRRPMLVAPAAPEPRSVLCERRPPLAPGRGLALFDARGVTPVPLVRRPAADPESRGPTGRLCGVDFVLVEGSIKVPPWLRGALGLTRGEKFGSTTLYTAVR